MGQVLREAGTKMESGVPRVSREGRRAEAGLGRGSRQVAIQL